MSMTTLRATVLHKVDDDSLGEDVVDVLINKALAYYSSRVVLPALEAYDSLVVSGASTPVSRVSLPDDYQRNLFYCNDGVSDRHIFSSASVMREDADKLGYAGGMSCSVSQKEILFKEEVDSDYTFAIGYSRQPEEDEVDIFPAGFEDWPVIWFCCWQLYDDIEDGDDGNNPNTTKYEERVKVSIAEMRSLVQESQPQRTPPRVSGWI